MNDELAAVKERYEATADPLRKQIDALTEGLHTWCEANRDTLTQHGKTKTAALPAGEVAWRTRPPSVRITGAEAVRGVPGIAISQGEDFIVTPFEAELATEGA